MTLAFRLSAGPNVRTAESDRQISNDLRKRPGPSDSRADSSSSPLTGAGRGRGRRARSMIQPATPPGKTIEPLKLEPMSNGKEVTVRRRLPHASSGLIFMKIPLNLFNFARPGSPSPFAPGPPVFDRSRGQPVFDRSRGQPVFDRSRGQPVIDRWRGQPVIARSRGQPVIDRWRGQPVIDRWRGRPVIDRCRGHLFSTRTRALRLPHAADGSFLSEY